MRGENKDKIKRDNNLTIGIKGISQMLVVYTGIQIPVQWVQRIVIKIMGKGRERSEGVSGNVIVNYDPPI